MVKIFASSGSWIEGAAVQQLEQTAALPGVQTVVGMPDLHPGKGCAVGAVTYSEGIVYPHLVGNDIGCGYSLFQTSINKHKVKPNRLADMISGIDDAWDGDVAEYLAAHGVDPVHTSSLGTVGGGNHFAELQQVSKVDSITGIDDSKLVLLVHSGSRSLGEALFQHFAAKCGNKGFEVGSEYFAEYMAAHNNAVKWATANRSRHIHLSADAER